MLQVRRDDAVRMARDCRGDDMRVAHVGQVKPLHRWEQALPRRLRDLPVPGIASRMLSRLTTSFPVRSGRLDSSAPIHSASMRFVDFAAKRPVVATLISASHIATG